ncbi:hypothetical protein E2562_010237 [Oryza meyeriana var. granulata]|uniref:Uncharacterized protein n=1 Tax=Oryza meyeriana var. granulata TaxID=110450 RepID=A0A6G1EJP2_9ORYZ|nr:hypothetical protein E2562_010237 [Oryza meyeriana var. granulata]
MPLSPASSTPESVSSAPEGTASKLIMRTAWERKTTSLIPKTSSFVKMKEIIEMNRTKRQRQK